MSMCVVEHSVEISMVQPAWGSDFCRACFSVLQGCSLRCRGRQAVTVVRKEGWEEVSWCKTRLGKWEYLTKAKEVQEEGRNLLERRERRKLWKWGGGGTLKTNFKWTLADRKFSETLVCTGMCACAQRNWRDLFLSVATGHYVSVLFSCLQPQTHVLWPLLTAIRHCAPGRTCAESPLGAMRLHPRCINSLQWRTSSIVASIVSQASTKWEQRLFRGL